MLTVRRWYIYLVSAISLQSVSWASITLLRDLLPFNQALNITSLAFQIAVIVVGAPIYLVHWLWAYYLARRDDAERESSVRQLYLYAMLAAFLAPILATAYDLCATLLRTVLNEKPFGYYPTPSSLADVVVDALVTIVVLGVLWLYHNFVILTDGKRAALDGSAATLRRFYVLGFSAVGLATMLLGIIQLLRWLMYQLGGGAMAMVLSDEIARLLIGVPTWLVFWLWAQWLFGSAREEERESALRKFYLYLVVFVAVLGTVSSLTVILAGLFRAALALPASGDLRDPLSVVLAMLVAWVYHAYVLRGDTRLGLVPRQAGLRRLYRYLIAGVALAAFLIGVSGDLAALIRALMGEFFGAGLKEQVAWFSAAMVAGLLVWLVPWGRAQRDAVRLGPAGADERRSVVRKIYLYFYLFVATMTMLGSAVYIVFRILSLLLGQQSTGNLLADLGQAIAFSLVALGVWLYHGYALRGDGQRAQQEKVERLAGMRIAVLDVGQGTFGRALLAQLRREWPGLNVMPIGLTAAAAEAMGADRAADSPHAQLHEAALIVGPWQIAVAGAAGGAVSAELANAVVASAARKLLVPAHADGWDWVGADGGDESALVQQTARAIKQVIEGEEVRAARSSAVNVVIGLFFAFMLLCVLLQLIPLLLSGIR